jgi:hypothetical protein
MRLTIFVLTCLFALPWTALGQSSYSDYDTDQKEVFFSDLFTSNANAWPTGVATEHHVRVEKGTYVVQDKQREGSTRAWKVFEDFDSERNFEIQVSLRISASTDNSEGHAIFWGADTESEEKYRFFLNKAGSFSIDLYDGSSFQDFVGWTPTGADMTRANKITIRKVGSTYYFFLNEELVHEMPFEPFYGSAIGFHCGKSSTLVVDDFQLLYLPDAGAVAEYGYFTGADREIVFSDNFTSNTNAWPTGVATEHHVRLEKGTYVIQDRQTQGSTRAWKAFDELDPSLNFQIEVTMRVLASTDESEGHALFWGGNSDTEEKYRFFINKAGSYSIDLFDGAGFRDFVGWTPSGLDMTRMNKITVRKVDRMYYFYLNENLVHQMDFEPFRGSNIGFHCGTASTLVVDDFSISYLPSDGMAFVERAVMAIAEDYNAYTGTEMDEVFFDDFENNDNAWAQGYKAGQYDLKIADGTFRIKSLSDNARVVWCQGCEIDDARDWQLDVRLKWNSGKTTTGHQLWFGEDSESGKGYSFAFNADGKYAVEFYKGDDYLKYQPYTVSSAIEGTGWNKMTVRKVIDKYLFFINEELVFSTPYRPFVGPRLGVAAGGNSAIEMDAMRLVYLGLPNFEAGEEEVEEPIREAPMVNANAPVITIKQPKVTGNHAETHMSTVRVSGTVKSPAGLEGMRVTLNGVKVQIDDSGYFTAELQIEEGENNITVVATDAKGLTSTQKFVVEFAP